MPNRNRESLVYLRADLDNLFCTLGQLQSLAKRKPLGLQRIFTALKDAKEMDKFVKVLNVIQGRWDNLQTSNASFENLKTYIAAEQDSRDIKGIKGKK